VNAHIKTKLTEKTLRLIAKKAGLKLHRSRGGATDGHEPEAVYSLVDPDIDFVVFGRATNGYEPSLEQFGAYLELSPAERWYRLQEAVDSRSESRGPRRSETHVSQ